MRYALVDTGIWIARFDTNGPHRTAAINTLKSILESPIKILMPWPILYETLRTKYVEKSDPLREFCNIVNNPNVERIDDSPYREEALNTTLRKQCRFPEMSMVDCLLYLMMQSGEFRIVHFATFDSGRHFGQICAEKGIEILPGR